MVQVLVWAARDNPKPGGAHRGDLIDWLDDGVHPEKRIVGGPRWNDPVDFSTGVGRCLTAAEMRAGVRPDYNILEVPGLTAAQARYRLAQRVASVLELPLIPRRLQWLSKLGRIDHQKVPDEARRSLRETGRAELTATQLWFAMTLKDGLTVETIRSRVTENGRFPSEWTKQE